MLYCKSLSLAAALFVFPALPTTGATAFSRQTLVPHSALPTPHSYPPISPRLRTPNSTLRTRLAQATDPRKEAADRVLKPCWEHLQQHPTMMVMI